MTTIVASKKHRQMAADRKVTDTGSSTKYSTRKIHVIGKSAIGCGGDAATIAKFIRWLESGADPDDKPKLEKDAVLAALVLNPAGLFVFDTHFEPDEIDDEFYAVGTGAQAALAALHMGASPRRAVEIAAKVDINTEGPIDIIGIK